MKYTYIAAWGVLGGVHLPSDCESVELYGDEDQSFILTRTPADQLALVDRGRAIAWLLMDGMFGGQVHESFDAGVEHALARVVEYRERRAAGTVLIYEAHGDVDVELDPRLADADTQYLFMMDAVDKLAVRRTHDPCIEAMKMALALEGSSPCRFAPLTNDVYLTDEDGRVIHSPSYRFSAEPSVSSPFASDGKSRVARRYGLLAGRGGNERILRLSSQMSDGESDRLKAFLSGWAALEILVAKYFKSCEESFMSPLLTPDQPALRQRFLGRVRDVMKDKYRLTDKFAAVSVVLFPHAPDEDVQKDFEEFTRLKKFRDKLYHGEEFADADLPLAELRTLLRKYLQAHVESSIPAS